MNRFGLTERERVGGLRSSQATKEQVIRTPCLLIRVIREKSADHSFRIFDPTEQEKWLFFFCFFFLHQFCSHGFGYLWNVFKNLLMKLIIVVFNAKSAFSIVRTIGNFEVIKNKFQSNKYRHNLFFFFSYFIIFR